MNTSNEIFQVASPRASVELHLPDGRVLCGPRSTPVGSFLKALPEWNPHDPIVGAVVNGELRELTHPISMDSRVRLVKMSDPDGSGIYRRSVTFLLVTAFEEIFPAADIVCQVSRWEEAFGWVNTEAMTCCKPIVATRVGGIPEIVQDGVTGYLVAPRRPDETAARILELVGNPELARKMGAAGRRVVEERFSLQANVQQLLKLYGV